MDPSFANRSKVLHLETSLYRFVTAAVSKRVPRTDVCSAADSRACGLSLGLSEDARRHGNLPTLVSGCLLGVGNAVFKRLRFLHGDEVRFGLGEILGRCIPAAAVDGLKGPVTLRNMERGAGRERVVRGPLVV